jgi:hypothetical protein
MNTTRVICVLGLLVAAVTGAGARPASRAPVAVGSFIQWYLVKDWGDAEWQAEFRYLKEAGMRYLVLAPTVDSKAHVAYYPTRLAGYRQAGGCVDIVDACLRNAARAGFRVFLGLNMNDDWWVKGAKDPAWLDAQMDIGSAVADELYANYLVRYPRAIAGWYWVWEVDNLNFQTPRRREALAEALDRTVRHLKALSPKLPVLFCPFMNAACGTPGAYADLWTYVFAHTALSAGDIFCPQDGVGAGGLKLEQLDPWFRALRRAVDSKRGLQFWSDAETFCGDDLTSAPLNRFVAQMRAVQPYVEQCLCFAYSHYYSPTTSPPGFHAAYREYVRTGKLTTTPPSPPANLRCSRLAPDSAVLAWDAASGGAAVCGYIILRDGKLLARMQLGKAQSPSGSAPSYVDKAPPDDMPCTYAVKTYDFAGNLSAPIETVLHLGP